MQRTSFATAFGTNFSPLRIRNFRIYFSGQAVSLIGTWLQITAQGIVVYKLSGGSATALGAVGMLNTLPLLLFGPLAGVWADRLDRRWLLIVSQTGAMCLAFVLAALLQSGLAQLWHVYVLAFCLGTITSIDFPAQQAFLGDLAGMAEVRRAVNLNAMILQVSRMLGPAFAGTLVAWLGAAPAFWLNGLSFAAVIGSLLLVRTQQVRSQRGAGAAGGMGAALGFIRSQPRIQDLLVFVMLLTFFGLAVLTIVPAVAHGVPQVTGWLLAASGFGAAQHDSAGATLTGGALHGARGGGGCIVDGHVVHGAVVCAVAAAAAGEHVWHQPGGAGGNDHGAGADASAGSAQNARAPAEHFYNAQLRDAALCSVIDWLQCRCTGHGTCDPYEWLGLDLWRAAHACAAPRPARVAAAAGQRTAARSLKQIVRACATPVSWGRMRGSQISCARSKLHGSSKAASRWHGAASFPIGSFSTRSHLSHTATFRH